MSHGLPNRGGKRKKVTLPPPTPNSENGETEQDSTKTEMKEKPRKRKKGSSVTSADAQLDMTWICTECREAECITHPDSPLLLCEGECSRPFHFPCAGLASLPPSDEKWICTDCLKGQHQVSSNIVSCYQSCSTRLHSVIIVCRSFDHLPRSVLSVT